MAEKTPRTQNRSPSPRASVLALITAVEEGALLTDAMAKMRDMPPEHAARVQRLATTVFRWMDRADRMLGPYLKHRPDPAILNILRFGIVEMAVDGAAPHGVINELVGLARKVPGQARAAGMVNAVLRRASRELEKWDGLPIPRLPKTLRKPLIAAYGKANVEAMEAAHARAAPVDLTLRDPAARDLGLDGTLLPTGSLRLNNPGQISALPGYEAGAWWVQDAAAALPARILNTQPGERVLDMCAAPGGKTMQLAATGANVTALDLSERRQERVRENLARTGLTAEVVVADGLTYAAEPFDAILLDAPCSATGTIRRHPDLPTAKAGRDLAELIALQSALFDRAIALLKPGGRLVFCTCSLLPEEGEDHVRQALARHASMQSEPEALAVPGVDRAWIAAEGLRLRPDYWQDEGGMDGFFIAHFRKSADA